MVRFDPSSGEVLWQQLDYAEACANLRVIEEAGSVFCGSWLGALTRLDLATGDVTRELIAQNGGGGSSGRPEMAPSSSASAATRRSSPDGDSTAPVRSRRWDRRDGAPGSSAPTAAT